MRTPPPNTSPLGQRVSRLMRPQARFHHVLCAVLIVASVMLVAVPLTMQWMLYPSGVSRSAYATVLSTSHPTNTKIRFRTQRGETVVTSIKRHEFPGDALFAPVRRIIPDVHFRDWQARAVHNAAPGTVVRIRYGDQRRTSVRLASEDVRKSVWWKIARVAPAIPLSFAVWIFAAGRKRREQLRIAASSKGRVVDVTLVDQGVSAFLRAMKASAVVDDGEVIRVISIWRPAKGFRVCGKRVAAVAHFHPIDGSVAVLEIDEHLVLCRGASKLGSSTLIARPAQRLRLGLSRQRQVSMPPAYTYIAALLTSSYALLFAVVPVVMLMFTGQIYWNSQPLTKQQTATGVVVDNALAQLKPAAGPSDVQIVDDKQLFLELSTQDVVRQPIAEPVNTPSAAVSTDATVRSVPEDFARLVTPMVNSLPRTVVSMRKLRYELIGRSRDSSGFGVLSALSNNLQYFLIFDHSSPDGVGESASMEPGTYSVSECGDAAWTSPLSDRPMAQASTAYSSTVRLAVCDYGSPVRALARMDGYVRLVTRPMSSESARTIVSGPIQNSLTITGGAAYPSTFTIAQVGDYIVYASMKTNNAEQLDPKITPTLVRQQAQLLEHPVEKLALLNQVRAQRETGVS